MSGAVSECGRSTDFGALRRKLTRRYVILDEYAAMSAINELPITAPREQRLRNNEASGRGKTTSLSCTKATEWANRRGPYKDCRVCGQPRSPNAAE
jgi:hypothetical protein